jgi:hypothetical protein
MATCPSLESVVIPAITHRMSGMMPAIAHRTSGIIPAPGHRGMGGSFAHSWAIHIPPQPFARFSAPVGGAAPHAPRPNGPAEPSEGLGPGGWMEYDWPMDRITGSCPGGRTSPTARCVTRVTPTRRCGIGHHHRRLCGIGHDPGFHHKIQTIQSSEIQITNGQMPMNRSIPTAPNGGRDLSPGLSAAMPWDLTPQHVMRPEGALEPADGGEGGER